MPHALTCPWPVPFPSTHPGPIKQHLSPEGRNTSPVLLWDSAHTLPCCQTALAPFWGHLAFSEPAKYILSTVRICQSRPKPFTRFPERTTQSATVPTLPLPGDKHLPSPQLCLYPCPLHSPALPAVACAEEECWLCTQTPNTPLVNGECSWTALQLWESQVSDNTQNWICLTYKNVGITVKLCYRCDASILSSPKGI